MSVWWPYKDWTNTGVPNIEKSVGFGSPDCRTTVKHVQGTGFYWYWSLGPISFHKTLGESRLPKSTVSSSLLSRKFSPTQFSWTSLSVSRTTLTGWKTSLLNSFWTFSSFPWLIGKSPPDPNHVVRETLNSLKFPHTWKLTGGSLNR